MNRCLLLCLFSALLTASACGIKGPLYLPEQEAPKTQAEQQ